MSEQTETWRKLADRLAPDYMTCPALVEACDLIDQLEARLTAAESVCCFFGAWNLGAEVAKELTRAYENWKAIRPK